MEVRWIFEVVWCLLHRVLSRALLWMSGLSIISCATQSPSFRQVVEMNQAWICSPLGKISTAYLLWHRKCSFWQSDPSGDTCWRDRLLSAWFCPDQHLWELGRTKGCFRPFTGCGSPCTHSYLLHIAKCLILIGSGSCLSKFLLGRLSGLLSLFVTVSVLAPCYLLNASCWVFDQRSSRVA